MTQGQYQGHSKEIPLYLEQLGAHCTPQELLEEIHAGSFCTS